MGKEENQKEIKDESGNEKGKRNSKERRKRQDENTTEK